MKITIPYEYTKEIIPKYCRKPRGVKFNSQISVTVHEVTGEQAPIAIRQHDKRYNDKTENYEPTIIYYRWYNRKLWILHSFSRAVGSPYETQTAQQFMNDPYPMANGLPYYHAYHSQQENRCRIMGWARNTLLIDGMRWQQIDEPRYVINTFGLGHNHGGTGLFVENFYNSNISKTRYFRIDQHDLMLNTAITIALNRGDDESASYIKENHIIFDILIPEAIRLNPNKEHGDGDPFINQLEGIINKCPDTMTAGLMVMSKAVNLIGGLKDR